jgi:signal transduction histidine kinase/HPt (histidine-containing phosphotransfer) domain-containing protein/ActR/RegA family two-component response regulator
VVQPAFDRAGTEILVLLGQPVSAILPAFTRQGGVDVALLSGPDPGAPDRLFRQKLYAVTNAPVLLPKLRAVAAELRAAPQDRAFDTGGRTPLMLLLTPLSQEAQGEVYALFVADQSPALERVRGALRTGVAITLGGLLLSSLTLWWFLTPLTRRLWQITRALPLLADKRYDQAEAELHSSARLPHLTDELDLLGERAQWLTRRLKQLDDAEAASAAKSRFLATVSHEVRTPLNGILGLLELLQHSQLDAGQRDSIGMVRDSALSLLGVLDDTLDLARIEAGRIDLNQAPFSIEQIVAGCAETAAPRARAKGLRLVTYTDPALPQVVGDAMRLRQVLGNLCSNAVKFTATGRVAVRAELVRRGTEAVRVRFCVEDTGIGIPPEARSRLFQPFQQGDGATAAHYGGSGLGLSISQGLVTCMGGRIELSSTPGAGSEFSFTLELPVAASAAEASPDLAGVEVEMRLPRADEREWLAAYLRAAGGAVRAGARLVLREADPFALALGQPGAAAVRLLHPVHRATLLRAVAAATGKPAAEPAVRGPEAPPRRLRVLAVDDHPTNREVIQRQLARLGHQATPAADGAAALRLLAQADYDLLLTDLRMPLMGGIELVRAIRSQERAGQHAGRLPALALSAQMLAGEAEHCLEAGMDACLTKPLSLDELRLALAPWSGNGAGGAEPCTRSFSAAPIDRAALARLLGGDQETADLLLDDFVRINGPLVDRLAQLARRGELGELALAAHRLLGSARTIGAAELGQVLAELESAARERREADARRLAACAAEAYAAVCAGLARVSA